jgi:RNA polymerase sigma-70 factor, ECF subfamily
VENAVVQAQLADAELVALLREMPARGIAALYDRYGRMVYAVAHRIVQDHGAAEEITQDVFVRCWRAIDRYRPEQGSLAAWLLSIAHNRAIDELRSRRGKELRQPHVEDADEPVSIDPGFDAVLLRGEVRQALAALPESQREVIELIFWGDLSRREIAERLRLPLGTVHTRLRLGMDKLREALARLMDAE